MLASVRRDWNFVEMRGLKKFKLSVAFEVHLPAEMPQSRATLRASRLSKTECANNQNAAAPRGNTAMGASKAIATTASDAKRRPVCLGDRAP